MIMSFSVPEQDKFLNLITWYKSQDSNDRSRNFREIFLTYLEKKMHIVEQKPIMTTAMIQLKQVDVVNEPEEIDLDEKFSLIGFRG